MTRTKIIICIFVLFIVLMSVLKHINNINVENFLEFIHIPKNAGTTIENIANDKKQMGKI